MTVGGYSVGDVVGLPDGSVGVVSEIVPGHDNTRLRVAFPDNTFFLAEPGELQGSFSNPTFSVSDEVTVRPYAGTITEVNGAEYTFQAVVASKPTIGPIARTGTFKVPYWRLVLDNDTQLQRIW